MMEFGRQLAREVVGRERSVGIGVVGDSGTGKSRLAALMGVSPIIVAFEAQGLATIRQWNPDAIVVPVFRDDAEGTFSGVPHGPVRSPKGRCTILRVVMEAIQAGQPSPDGGGWLVPAVKSFDRATGTASFDAERSALVDGFALDSVSEWSRVEVERLLGRTVASEVDPGDAVPLDMYNKLYANSMALMRRLRELPIPWLGLFLADDRETQDGVKTYPRLQGRKAAPELAQFFNAFGLLVKRADPDGVVFAACYELASDRAITKSCSGLDRVELLPADPTVNSPAAWFRRILDAQPGVAMAGSTADQAGMVPAEQKATEARGRRAGRGGVQ